MAELFAGWTNEDKRQVLALNPVYVEQEHSRQSPVGDIGRVTVDAMGAQRAGFRSDQEIQRDRDLIHRLADEEVQFLQRYYQLQRIANEADQIGDLRSCIRAYEAMADMAPWDGIAAMSIGVTYAQQGQFDLGTQWVRRAAATDPDNPRIQQNLNAIQAAAGLP